MGVKEYLLTLVGKANKAANSEEAIAIRKKLIKYGIIGMIVGFGGSFICFVLFASLAIASVNSFGFSPAIIIPFVLFIPCGVIGGLGTLSLKAGLSIVVGQAVTKFIDENSYCPNCGDLVTDGEKFCNKCGVPLLSKKHCSKCGTDNDMKDNFCKECGNKL